MSVRKEWADAENVSAAVVGDDGDGGASLVLSLGGSQLVIEGDLELFAQNVADAVSAAGYDFPIRSAGGVLGAEDPRKSDNDDDDDDEGETCSQCGEAIDSDDMWAGHGMCSGCLHNAIRSGWEPGQ